MSSYQEQAQAEMYDAIATQDRGRDRDFRAEIDGWTALAAGGADYSAVRHNYRDMSARYRGKCDGCGSQVLRKRIAYDSGAPSGHKVFCHPCAVARGILTA